MLLIDPALWYGLLDDVEDILKSIIFYLLSLRDKPGEPSLRAKGGFWVVAYLSLLLKTSISFFSSFSLSSFCNNSYSALLNLSKAELILI